MISVIITAGGTSSRFGEQNKLLFKIKNKPVILYCIETFNELDYIDEIIISANKSIIDDLNKICKSISKVKIIEGGITRQESVFKGLKECRDCKYVIIHDGARPFITKEVIKRCLNNAKEKSASIVAVKTVDTVKIVLDNGEILSTPDRKTLWNAQTPQIFEFDKIFEVHKKYQGENYTDDALLFEKAGLKVFITEGEYSNYKITTIEDVK